jgi:outer membrane protein TolC
VKGHFFFTIICSSLVVSANTELNQYLEKAQQQHPEYGKLEIEYNASKRFLAQKKRSFYPRIDLYSTWDNIQTYQESFPKDQYSQQIGARLSYNLFNNFSDYYHLKFGQAIHQFNKSNILKKKLAIEKNILAVLLSRFQARAELEFLSEMLASQRDLLKKSKNRFSAGLLSKNDLDRIEIDLLQTEAQYEQKKIDLIQTKKSSYQIESAHTLGHWPWIKSLVTIKNQLKKLIDNRPPLDLQIARTISNRQTFESKYLKYTDWLSIDANLSRFHFRNNLIDDWGWSVGLNFTFNLFGNDPWTSRRQLAQSKYQYALKQLNFENKRAQNNYKLDWRALELEIKQFELTQRSKALSNRGYENSLKRYRQGKVSINELYLEQNRQLNSGLNFIKQAYHLHLAIIDYCHQYGQSVNRQCFKL